MLFYSVLVFYIWGLLASDIILSIKNIILPPQMDCRSRTLLNLMGVFNLKHMDREKDLKSEEEREALVKFQAGKYEGYYVWDVPPTYLANAYFNWRNISDEFKMQMLIGLIKIRNKTFKPFK